MNEVAWSTLKSILNQQQWDQFVGSLRRCALLRRGLLPSLVTRRLGTEIRITDARRSRLRKIAGKYTLELTHGHGNLNNSCGVKWRSLSAVSRRRI